MPLIFLFLFKAMTSFYLYLISGRTNSFCDQYTDGAFMFVCALCIIKKLKHTGIPLAPAGPGGPAGPCAPCVMNRKRW